MPTPTKGPRLGGGPAHERLMLANLATSLFEHDRITTTEAKAKRLRPLAERLITFAKRGDLHARRQVMSVIRDKDVVHKLFAEIGPKFAERARRLHPHRQDRSAQGRQRADGGHRAGRGRSAPAVREAERARGTKDRGQEGADRADQGDRRGRQGRVGDRCSGRRDADELDDEAIELDELDADEAVDELDDDDALGLADDEATEVDELDATEVDELDEADVEDDDAAEGEVEK